MHQLLIRNLELSTINALKELAKEHNRSLQAEVKHLLEAASKPVGHNRAKLAEKIRTKLSKKIVSDQIL